MKGGDAGAIILGCLGIIALFVIIGLGLSWLFMIAWNAFMVPVFGLPVIDIWTALAGYVLLTIVGGAFKAVFNGSRS